MQILLASAKIMHDVLNTAPDVELSAPRFAHEAEAFARDMAQYSTKDGRHQVRAKKGFSMIGYTQMDLGIAKYHFEIGAGKDHFAWI